MPPEYKGEYKEALKGKMPLSRDLLGAPRSVFDLAVVAK